MKTITVYTHRTQPTTFRVVAGEHKFSSKEERDHYSAHAYQGATVEDAARAAFSHWKDRRQAIAVQIAKFFSEDAPSSAEPPRNPAVGETAPAADNGGRISLSAWLSEHTDSHLILDHNPLAQKFRLMTGCDDCWPVHSVAETREHIASDVRGGTVHGEDTQRVAYGYEIAIAVARKYVIGFQSTKMGRGFAWREAIDALKTAGL